MMNTRAELDARIAFYRQTERYMRMQVNSSQCTHAEQMEYAYYRFLDGDMDDTAIEGWRYVMNARQRDLAQTKKQLKSTGLIPTR